LLDEAVRLGEKLGAVLGPRRYRPQAGKAVVS